MIKNSMKKYYSEGSRINQFFMAFMVMVPVFAYGQSVGWMSPMGLLLQSEATPAAEPVSDVVISWMASIAYLVGFPAVFLFCYIADNYGRKKALILTSASMTACWSVKLVSTANWALITGRAITGLVVAGAYVVSPLYMKEISEDSIRGALGSLVILSQNAGNLMLYIMGDLLNYHVILWICLAVPVLHLVFFSTMPESPAYLLKCGEVEKARAVVAWLRCRQVNDPLVDGELKALMMEAEVSVVREASVVTQIFKDQATFRAFRITLMVNLARDACGCIAVLLFASTIFEAAAAGSGGQALLSSNQQAALLGTVQLVGSCLASSIVERTGRKPLLTTTCVISGLGMGLLGIWFYLTMGFGGTEIIGQPAAPGAWLLPAWLPVAALCVCIFCDAGGLQPVPFVIMTEIFSFQLRGTVTGFIIAFACILDASQLRIFIPVVNGIGFCSVFWIFSGVCLVSTVYIVLFVPETKMRSLEEIYDGLRDKKKETRIVSSRTNESKADDIERATFENNACIYDSNGQISRL